MAQEAASAYAALAGATFSGDVGIESASPRSHMALSTGGTADRRRLGWILTGSQALLRVETDAGAAVRNFLILDLVTGTFGAGVNTPIDYSAAVHVKMPTPTAATHASRITAYNAATGQIQRDGMEQGDTGWRRVSPINGYTGTFDMKRVGNVVQFRAALLDGSAHTNDRFYAAPSGFRWRPMGAGIESTFSIETGNTLTARGIYQNSYHLWTNAVTASGAACDLMWTTEDAWPSTLPGTQVTAPATLS